jgi:hypothetical protein
VIFSFGFKFQLTPKKLFALLTSRPANSAVR